jgi:transcription antitermination factor NusG
VLKISGKDRSRVKSMLNIFGRMTVVEFDMADVEAA